VQQGQLIAGRYRLDRPVGAGGRGAVWRAVDTELDRAVAAKRATVEGTDVLRAARIAAGLRHPSVVTLHDSVIEDGDRRLILHYVTTATALAGDASSRLPRP
jgi:eukaryotic-like serine/threonine-protein kinase